MPGRRALLAAVPLVVAALVAGCGSRPEPQALTPRPSVGLEAPSTTGTTVPVPPETVLPTALPGEEVAAPRGPRPPRAARPAGPARPKGPQVTGRIEIPKIGLSHTTYEGISLSVINHGPSHWPGTPMPGHRGNSVFPGHRTTYSRPFWDADKLRPGDQIIFTTADGRFVYEVFDSIIVRANEMWIVDQTSDYRLTIFGCHPKGSAKYRYVVRSRLVSQPAGAHPPAAASPSTTAPPPPPQQAPPPPPSTTAPPSKPCMLCLP